MIPLFANWAFRCDSFQLFLAAALLEKVRGFCGDFFLLLPVIQISSSSDIYNQLIEDSCFPTLLFEERENLAFICSCLSHLGSSVSPFLSGADSGFHSHNTTAEAFGADIELVELIGLPVATREKEVRRVSLKWWTKYGSGGICEVASRGIEKIVTSFDKVEDRSRRLFAAIEDLGLLTPMQMIDVFEAMCKDQYKIDVFMGLPESLRRLYVLRILEEA
ncbi:hypothetical protein Pint_16825 [Pistacia integerrima]|uniref:Uncharacterized protein n=1 Tax=Pistacia integerrima TaxID=434235 RepID=A0ACC0ZCJ3_9ROSI|nr:hypothetical protein Pint_16825 [Pistacia integerrima]